LYACGLLLAALATPPLPWLFGLAFVCTILSAFWGRVRPWLLIPIIVFSGWTGLFCRSLPLSPNDLRLRLGADAEEVFIRGTLTETPSVRMFIADEKESFRTLATIEVNSIQHDSAWIPATGTLLAITPGDLSGLGYTGSKVEVRGIISTPLGPAAPGLFDYRTYLARQGIYFQIKVASTNDWVVSGIQITPLSDRFLAWAQRTLARGLPEEDESLRLLFAMTLGWKTGLTNEVYLPFMQSGTMHIFAISGLHIALIAGLLVTVLRALQTPRRWCGIVVIPLIWFYTAATGWQPSAIRSTIMMTVIIVGWSLSRPTDLINSLAAAALIILVWQPEQLFQASFQLSFFVVLSIALFMPPLESFVHARFKRIQPDPYLPRQLVPRWRKWRDAALRWFCLSLATSLAAWLGSLPLTIQYFNIFSPVTLLANLIIVPLSSAALACNLGSLLCGDWLPWIGTLFNHSAWLWMRLMVEISHLSVSLPWAFGYVAAPPAWVFIAYYALLLGAMIGWIFKKTSRPWILAIGAPILVLAIWEWHRAANEVVLTVLPLNGGHAVFVDSPGRRNDCLIDCGNTNASRFITQPFLHAQGVNSLNRLILTHGDLQHIGGTGMLQAEFPGSTTYIGPVRFRSATYRRILVEMDQRHRSHAVVSRDESVGGWTVLHPDRGDAFPKGDDACMVLMGNFYGTRILLLGDLGRAGQEALLQRYQDLKADIIVTGLPDNGEPVCNGLLSAANPKILIVADTEYPATKRASAALKSRLASAGPNLIFTRFSGAVVITARPDGVKVSVSKSSIFSVSNSTHESSVTLETERN
jgi:ComEC/Rec2-related protein